MKINSIFSLRFIKAFTLLFFFAVAILLAVSDRAVSGHSGSKSNGLSGDTQLTWGRMGSCTYAVLWDVWGTSADDIFAVGADGTITHNNGNAWSMMESNSASQLRGVWGSSSSNVFAVGSEGTILHFNGSVWSLVYGGDEWFYLFDVWGSSVSDVFAVGEGGTIVHYDGNAWSAMDSGTTFQLTGVWGSSASDVFAVGLDGKIFHYDGNTWASMDSGTSNSLWGVWGTSATDVYAVGLSCTILHYNGSTWSPMPVDPPCGSHDVWGTSATDIFAVGGGSVSHYDGSTWSAMTHDISSMLYGVWGSSSSDVYAVGDTVVFGSSTKRTILHYGEWDPQAIWVIPNREEPGWESVTDFVEAVGESKNHLAFKLWCDPLFAAETDVSITNTHPAFSVNSNVDHIQCNTYYHVNFAFSPTEPGLATDTVTVSGDIDTIALDLIGNGVPVETPEYWITDLPDIIARRLSYDASRDYLYITDYNADRLVVFSPKLRGIMHEIPVGNNPMGMAITPDGKRLYVANSGEYSISEIDLETMTELRKIAVPPLNPLTPYDIAVVNENMALVGGNAGWGSAGPICQLNLKTDQASPRADIGSGNRPVLRTSTDFSTTAILLEPGASPSTVARFDTASDSSIAQQFDMERGVAINNDGTRMAITWEMDNTRQPDMRLVDRDLNTIICLKLVELPLGVDFHPVGKYIYATGGYSESSIEEVSFDSRIQTRHLDYPMPQGYEQMQYPQTLVVSKDGLWVYALLLQSGAPLSPPSKLLAVKINKPVTGKGAMPWLMLLLDN